MKEYIVYMDDENEQANIVDELVRCKDCKHYDRGIEDCKMMNGYDWSFSPEDYCSYGVRKE